MLTKVFLYDRAKSTARLAYFFVVEILNGAYSGQKLIALVARKMIAKAPKRMPIVPLTAPLSNSTPITSATNVLIARSVVPIFFVMMFTARLGLKDFGVLAPMLFLMLDAIAFKKGSTRTCYSPRRKLLCCWIAELEMRFLQRKNE